VISALTRRPVAPTLTLPLDVLLVVSFAVVGRLSHDEAVDVGGVLTTAWPFLAGLAAAWLLVRWRSGAWPAHLGHGITVWVVTVAVGMVLRALTGAGTAPSFVVVATVVLGILLLGSRALIVWRPRRATA
jgi:hypothetical protein